MFDIQQPRRFRFVVDRQVRLSGQTAAGPMVWIGQQQPISRQKRQIEPARLAELLGTEPAEQLPFRVVHAHGRRRRHEPRAVVLLATRGRGANPALPPGIIGAGDARERLAAIDGQRQRPHHGQVVLRQLLSRAIAQRGRAVKALLGRLALAHVVDGRPLPARLLFAGLDEKQIRFRRIGS